ncbi:GNAT family N-acetyltransferase [Chitinophaga nivalis]|uniref:GNAT family N-acetyltransferase n=1 Tax=Chitinophaga nivalis TaxID=2991709 RepID=A0ABT3IRD4_9BACT|nr:GNAT family N-acetyltransferase [Chitinophaga nivalis]MCW3463763.1 GNAT family N-acetyltransferase [Chitinophaga nivalis]MCW3486547.1 GNAT family N-acetyltransferase [Chitinophaga nivalis]
MYRIQTATLADIPVIQDLTEKIWRPTYAPILTPVQIDYMIDLMYSTTSLTKQMNGQGNTFLILTDDDTPIGFAAYSPAPETGVYKLHKLYLDYNYQGKGAGKLLLEEVAAQVKTKGASFLELDVNRFNKAKQFYERQGFLTIKEKDTDIGDGFLMEDFVMRKAL